MPESNGTTFEPFDFATITQGEGCPTPPLPESDLAGDDSSGIDVLGDDFCGRVDKLRLYLIDLGGKIRSQRHIHVDTITRIAKSFILPTCGEVPAGDAAVYNALACIVGDGWPNTDAYSALGDWSENVAKTTGANPDNLLSIVAAKSFLQYLDDVSVEVSRGRGFHQGLTTSIGLEVFGLGSSTKEGPVDDRLIKVAQHLHVLLVPTLKLVDYCLSLEAPIEIPSIADANAGFLAGTLDERTWECLVLTHGGRLEYYKPLLYALRTKPQVIDLFRLRNREIINDETLDKQLRTLGFTDPNERFGVSGLRYEVPGPSDLVRFAQRHVFNPELLGKFGFNDERELGAFRLDAYHNTAGLNYPIFTGPLRQVVESVTGVSAEALASDYTARGLPEPTWAHAYYWSSWVVPPQTWAADARFKLDENRDTSLEPDWMKTLVFTDQDYNDLVRMNAYAPYFRDKMLAVNYFPPQLRFMRLLIAQDQMTEEQLIDQLKRLRMMPEVARKFARGIILDIEDKLNPVRSLEHGVSIRVFKSISKAYRIGTLDRNQSHGLMQLLGLKGETADTYLDAIDSDLRADSVVSAIRVIRKDYMEGAITQGTVVQLLARIGVAASRTEQITNQWQLERGLTVKMASTGQLLSWYSQGIIDQPTLLTRLGNLGWIHPDLLAYMAEGQLRLQRREQAIQAASLRSQKANASLIQKLLKDATQQRNELLREYRRLLPVGRLIKWARQGNISEIFFENALSAQEYPPDIIAQYWQEVIKDGPIPKPKQPKQSTGATGSIAPTS